MSPIAHLTRRTALAGALATLAAMSIAGLGLSAAPALAGDCPNAALRVENNSTRLPECRAYEMVTPLYKEGFGFNSPTYSDDGGVVGFVSLGNFAGNSTGSIENQYLATRSSAGWTTTSLYPPAATYGSASASAFGTEGLSADLRSSLLLLQRRAAPADPGLNYYLRGPDGSLTRVGLAPNGVVTQETTPDFTHILFTSASVAALYEFVGTGNEGPPRPVSVDNTGASTPGEVCRVGSREGGRQVSGMSADGRVIGFCNRFGGLWARVGGSATIAVAGSECTRTSGDPGGACNAPAAASFAGMSTDGSRVYFTTTQQLVNGDTDQTNDLYECVIPPGAPAPVGLFNPCSSLTEVSHAASAASVENVVRVSEDGSRVYFVAQGVLAGNLGANDLPAVAGAQNLYVWEKDAAHPAGQTTFIAALQADDIEADATSDGRYLVFDTASKLVASDTDEATDVYRYDAQTGALLRLSTDTDGTGGNEPFEARIPFDQPRYATPVRPTAMTSDASTVIFQTAEALSPADTDGTTDVYAWHEGQVSLISNGGGSAIGITSSGRDIFFVTGQPLTASDSGTEGDVYDARVGGGFDLSTPAPCSGEACQAALALQPQVPGASASAAFNGPGSPLTGETPPANPKPKSQAAAQKLAKALKACRAKHNKKQRTACEKRARNTYRRAK